MTITSGVRRPAALFILGVLLLTACGNSTAGVAPAALPLVTQPAQTAATLSSTAAPAATRVATARIAATGSPAAAVTLVPTLQPSGLTTPVAGTAQPTELTTQVAGTAQPTEPPLTSSEVALAPETSPAGDIPDSQAFVKYQSDEGGYTLDAPEGWGRTVSGPNVSFVNKVDGLSVGVTSVATATTAASAQLNEVEALKRNGRAVEVTSVKDAKLPGGAAVIIAYNSNSDPNPVTNKQVRLENISYLFFHNGRLATVRVWAPLGADNVDQWKRISESFRWR